MPKKTRTDGEISGTETSSESSSSSSGGSESDESDLPEHMGHPEDREPEEEEYFVEGIVTHELRLTGGVWKKWYLMKWIGYPVEGKEEDWVCEDDTG